MRNETISGQDAMAISGLMKGAFGGYAPPRIDAKAIVDEQRKYADTAFEAMRVASDGAHLVATRQLDLLHIISDQMFSLLAADHLTPEARAKQARRCFETALHGSLEIFNIAVSSGEEALQLVRQRLMVDGPLAAAAR